MFLLSPAQFITFETYICTLRVKGNNQFEDVSKLTGIIPNTSRADLKEMLRREVEMCDFSMSRANLLFNSHTWRKKKK